MVAAGRLADLLGRRRTFLSGVLVFTIASGLCAVAGSVEQLVAFRVLQGIGAAILVPASLALVVEGFDAARRAHAIGLWGAAAAIAAGLGPPIGGLLVEWAGWRWVLLVNVPLGIVAAIATKRMLVESRASGRRRMPDLRGALLLAVTLGLVTLGLVKGPDWGWLSVATVGSFLASVLTSVGFVHSSRSHPAPLVEPALLRSRSFVAGNLLTLVAAAGFYCYGLTHVLYLNYVWHYSLLKAGFAIAPAAVVAAVVAAALGRVAGRHGHRVIVLVGALVWAGSLVWYLQRVGSEPDFLRVWLPGQLLQGIGVGATLPVLSSAALAEVAKGGSYATSSAVVSTTRQLGIARLLEDLRRLGNRETPAVLSVLVLEDFAMAAYLPLFAVLATDGSWLEAVVGMTVAIAALLGAFAASYRWGHHVGRLVTHPDSEQLLLRVLGITLIVAAVAESLHASAAVGAFLVGLTLTGETADRARMVLTPLRDLFATIFFLGIGLSVDPGKLVSMLPVALALAAVTAATKVATGMFAARREGVARRGQLRAGTALVARGEFSLIIIGLAGASIPGVAALATAYVFVMAIVGPILARYTGGGLPAAAVASN